ncbi:G-protein coupled receptor isoform 2-T2 [Glossina fuscipes fuscipes]
MLNTMIDNNSSCINSNNNNNNGTNATITIAGTGSEETSDVWRIFEFVSHILNCVYVPIIVCMGSLGNILSVFVFSKTKLCKLSSSYYLAALAISDTCFLFGLFIQWLNFFDINIYNRDYFCQFFTFFSYLASFCSSWFVVAFTVERFIAVMYPLKRQTMCTVRRAKIVLSGISVLGVLHCIPFWISSQPVSLDERQTTICDIKNEYKGYILLLNYWDTIVVYAVPFVVIAILNVFTGWTVCKFAHVRRSLTMSRKKSQQLTTGSKTTEATTTTTTTTTTTALREVTLTNPSCILNASQTMATYRIPASLKRQKSLCLHFNTHNRVTKLNHEENQRYQQRKQQQQQHRFHDEPEQQRVTTNLIFESREGSSSSNFSKRQERNKFTNSSQQKVTKMLLIVSTVFVCLNLPSCVMRMRTFIETQSSKNEKATVVLQYIFHLLFITNFGINFVLYCVSGQNFRKAVLVMFRRVSGSQREGTTQLSASDLKS